jgi:hypothetical protein
MNDANDRGGWLYWTREAVEAAVGLALFAVKLAAAGLLVLMVAHAAGLL